MGCCSMSDLGATAFVKDLESRLGRKRIPLQCQWEITCRCNLKCIMCYTDCFNTPNHIAKELTTEEIFRIMDEMKEEGVLELTLTGGEPMARPDFKQIYLYAVRNGFYVTLFTNGTYITPVWIDLFKEYPPLMIEISFLGSQNSSFDALTQKSGSFERVKKAVELIVSADLPLSVKTTVMTVNEAEILEIKNWVASLRKEKANQSILFRVGVDIRPHIDGNSDSQQYQLYAESLKQLFSKDEELMQSLETHDKHRDDHPLCHSGMNRFHIDAYGNLQLCSSNRKKGYNLRAGNFKEAFFKKLPTFPCHANKIPEHDILSVSIS